MSLNEDLSVAPQAFRAIFRKCLWSSHIEARLIFWAILMSTFLGQGQIPLYQMKVRFQYAKQLHNLLLRRGMLIAWNRGCGRITDTIRRFHPIGKGCGQHWQVDRNNLIDKYAQRAFSAAAQAGWAIAFKCWSYKSIDRAIDDRI
jgi:hypothetical protein